MGGDWHDDVTSVTEPIFPDISRLIGCQNQDLGKGLCGSRRQSWGLQCSQTVNMRVGGVAQAETSVASIQA